ncbi:sirohydrochlorin chelatase [Paramicrobacterium fandaimingii]|uniref:sirohydrochlorin chelatase n=1 Tax=Paramicrobacterium fandaimingii TaxID=2708079 RepID=UPI00142023B9|nr:CbiX/SirB N-terminal domain-containing protein [Microbacterium fandaimingii]
MTATLPLVAVSHGTDSERGRAAVAGLVDSVRTFTHASVHESFVDVQHPRVDRMLAQVPSDAIAVPLLLSPGFHVHSDLRIAARDAAHEVYVAAALGPDAKLVDVLERRLVRAGLRDGDTVVFGAAGSRERRALAACRRMADLMAHRLRRPVAVGYVSAASPTIQDAVAHARTQHPCTRVIVANYHLAPGFFSDSLARVGADVVSEPLVPDDGRPPREIVELIIERYVNAHPA